MKKIGGAFLVIATILSFLAAGRALSENRPGQFLAKAWSDYRSAGNDSLRIMKLFILARYYNDYLGQNTLADSVSDLAIDIAERSYRSPLLLLAYNNYLESNDIESHYSKAMNYARKASQLAAIENDPKIEWRSCRNMAIVQLAGYQLDKALENSYRELSVAGSMDNNSLKAESYLDIGRCLEKKNQKIEAFRNYLNATFMAEKMEDRSLLEKCYSQLSSFYNFNKIFDKAIDYKLKQADLIKSTEPVDSVALEWTAYDLQVIELNSNFNQINEKAMEEVIRFSLRNDAERLTRYAFALYRTSLIGAEKIERLYDLYINQFPGELSRLSQNDPATYYRLRALFAEHRNRPDSAALYYARAEQYIRNDPNKVLQSRFYSRYGQFLMNHGKSREAISQLQRSYDEARKSSYFEYMLTASRQMEEVYAGMGNYKDAYLSSIASRNLSDSISNLSRKDQLVVMEINHETRQRELAAEKEHEKIVRRHNIQYTAIPVIIVGVFFLMMILGSFRMPEWTIRGMGFFSFIFLFEFIVLIADHRILEITAGEPWKILLIKVILIGILLPIHEWLEKKVTEYLLRHKLLDLSKISPARLIRKRPAKP